jgi:5-methyltetrahydrofolate--homocysteine methyltransferase
VGPGRAHAGDQPRAAQIARKAVGEQRFVAGSIGPTGHLPASDDPTLGRSPSASSSTVFDEQARGLVEGGADLIIIETAQDILEVKAAVFGAREAFKALGRAVPIQTASRCCPTAARCCWAPTSAPSWPRSRR